MALSPTFAYTQSEVDTVVMATVQSEWLDKWAGSLEYTLETLAAVEEADLDYRPTPGQMSLREQFQHLATNVYFLTSRFIHQPDNFDLAEARKRMATDADKAQLRTTITDAFAFGDAAGRSLSTAGWSSPAVGFWAGEKTKRVIFNLLQDHATHHRAQTLVYLRLLDRKPPAYRGW